MKVTKRGFLFGRENVSKTLEKILCRAREHSQVGIFVIFGTHLALLENSYNSGNSFSGIYSKATE